MQTRRNFLITTALALPSLAIAQQDDKLPAAFAALEKKSGGRLGVAVLNTATNQTAQYKADERFPFCSSFKFLLVAAVLHRIDTQKDDPRRQVDIPKQILGSSPITQSHAGTSMTIGALINSILVRSDNTAANVLLDTVGGPAALTAYVRTLGDQVFRLDRTETALNESKPGDPRDTTSPAAMLADLKTLLLGNALTPDSRNTLTQGMQDCVTGLARIRAGIPKTWRVADRNGANGENTTANIAAIWPTNKPPVLIAAYVTECPGPEEKRNAIFVEIGRLVAASV